DAVRRQEDRCAQAGTAAAHNQDTNFRHTFFSAVAAMGQAGPTAVVEAKRWARCSNASSESGLHTPPSDTTAPRDAPCSNRLTGTSSFLPVRLYGMAVTATTSSGTWRGERRSRRQA